MTQRPALDSILAHHRAYGLTTEKTTRRGRTVPHTSYKKLVNDPLVETARRYLSEDAYVLLVEGIGYGQFADDARADYAAIRKEWAAGRQLFEETWG